MSKRISLNIDDAEHVYEWLLMYWEKGPPNVGKLGGCGVCTRIAKRLEALIGKSRVRRTARAG